MMGEERWATISGRIWSFGLLHFQRYHLLLERLADLENGALSGTALSKVCRRQIRYTADTMSGFSSLVKTSRAHTHSLSSDRVDTSDQHSQAEHNSSFFLIMALGLDWWSGWDGDGNRCTESTRPMSGQPQCRCGRRAKECDSSSSAWKMKRTICPILVSDAVSLPYRRIGSPQLAGSTASKIARQFFLSDDMFRLWFLPTLFVSSPSS